MYELKISIATLLFLFILFGIIYLLDTVEEGQDD